MARLKRGETAPTETPASATNGKAPDAPGTRPENKRAELLALLAEAEAGLSKKDVTNGAFLNFNWKNSELYTFNDEVGVRVKLPSWWIVPEGSVPGAKFKEVLSKITDDDIQIHQMPKGTAGESAELIVIGKTAKAGIDMAADVPDSEAWFGPRAADMTEDHFEVPKIVTEEFLHGLRVCALSVSTNMTNYWMINVFVNTNMIFACDGFRATEFTLPDPATKFPIAIPYNAIPAILGFGGQSYTYNSKWLVLFKAKAQLFVKLTGEFDEAVHKQIEAISAGIQSHEDYVGVTGITLPQGLEALIDKANTFAAGDAPIDRHIALKFTEGNVTVRSEQQGVGWIEDSMPVPGNTQEFTMIISPVLLTEALSASREILVDAQMRKCKFIGGNFIHTLMLFA